jgi:hypothetical protein
VAIRLEPRKILAWDLLSWALAYSNPPTPPKRRRPRVRHFGLSRHVSWPTTISAVLSCSRVATKNQRRGTDVHKHEN